jgi:hypothetical protein
MHNDGGTGEPTPLGYRNVNLLVIVGQARRLIKPLDKLHAEYY